MSLKKQVLIAITAFLYVALTVQLLMGEIPGMLREADTVVNFVALFIVFVWALCSYIIIQLWRKSRTKKESTDA